MRVRTLRVGVTWWWTESALTYVLWCLYSYNWIPNIFSIDIDNIFTSIDVTIPHGIFELVRFFTVMSLPLICFVLYALFKSAALHSWIAGYIDNWKFRRNRAIFLYIFCLVASFAGLCFFDYPTSYDKVTNFELPDPVVNTLIAMAWGALTVIFLIWLAIVSVFRWKCVAPPITRCLR